MLLNRDLPIPNDRVVEALRGNHPAKRCGCWMTSRFRSLTQSLAHSTSKFPVEHFSTCESNFYRRSVDRRVRQGKSSNSKSGTINMKLLRQTSSSCKTVERWMISGASPSDLSPPQTFVSLLCAVATTATRLF